MSPTYRARTRAALAAALLMAALAGCTGEAKEAAPGTITTPTVNPSGAPTLTVKTGPLKVRLDPVRGELSAKARAGLRQRMRTVLGAWMTDSFAGPDYAKAFASYTPGAAALARRQRGVTTNAELGPELAETVLTRRIARVAVLAAGGRAVGVTAEVLVVLVGARQDGTQLELTVRGTLELTPAEGGWKVFGFDLARSVGAPGAHAASVRRQRSEQGGAR